jgi:hypothetical protein
MGIAGPPGSFLSDRNTVHCFWVYLAARTSGKKAPMNKAQGPVMAAVCVLLFFLTARNGLWLFLKMPSISSS